MPEIMHTEAELMPWYYNVSQSVGRGGVNRRDDTLLVQYLLKKAFEVKTYAPMKPAQPLAIDGNCGPVTNSYILAFQKRGNVLNPESETTTDSLVDHARGGGIAGSISGKLYTIAALNKALHDNFPEIFADPLRANDMPMELKLILTGLSRAAAA